MTDEERIEQEIAEFEKQDRLKIIAAVKQSNRPPTQQELAERARAAQALRDRVALMQSAHIMDMEDALTQQNIKRTADILKRVENPSPLKRAWIFVWRYLGWFPQKYHAYKMNQNIKHQAELKADQAIINEALTYLKQSKQ